MLTKHVHCFQGPKGAKGQAGDKGEMGIRGDPVSMMGTGCNANYFIKKYL